MKFIFTTIVVLATVVVATFGEENPRFLSDEFINFINSKNTTWKAARNININTSGSLIKRLFTVPHTKKETKHTLPTKIHSVDLKAIPESFDAREAWPECASVIGDIKDEGGCVAGWAFATVETISDRICILSNATIQISISAEDLISCCSDCNYGCSGGDTIEGWYYWSTSGIVTGGKYGTNDGCRAYSIEPCDHYTDASQDSCEEIIYAPDCVKVCDEGSSLEYKSDLRTGAPYYVIQTEAQIQTEIMTYGPIATSFEVYEEFLAYKSGVYQRVTDDHVTRGAVKLIGWGVEDGVPYWLAANSWNKNWGENGYFKILRGSNECEIESEPIGAFPTF
ncbi:hypothetical protein Zmor_007232 [Zophobas morio]|uniref:Peptidase C1A papain C-terminal domain-containing protein n=1 Tax=Zophobas morio TaxID=2755281 RepID=A0AA38MP54_9CUCU|nr:hypothetical protein Zmor_007232 [Zophobas morio]